MLPPDQIFHVISQVVDDTAHGEAKVGIKIKGHANVGPKPKPASRSIKRGPAWVENVRICIIKRESGGDYRAQNRHSTASGAYQFIDSTWHSVTGLPGHARDYSKSVQDRAFYKLFNNGKGKSNWNYPPKQCW